MCETHVKNVLTGKVTCAVSLTPTLFAGHSVFPTDHAACFYRAHTHTYVRSDRQTDKDRDRERGQRVCLVDLLFWLIDISTSYVQSSHASLRQYRKHARCCCYLFSCLTSQQHASVPQGRICSDNCTCCHTKIEVADQPFHLTSHSILPPGRPVPALTL